MKFEVQIMEFERGWGSRVDETVYFDSQDYNGDAEKTLTAAENYVVIFNSRNNLPEVPDWYMVASDPVMVSK